MGRRRERVNQNWETPAAPGYRWEHVAIEVLMDIRDELQRLNRLLGCQNFLDIPRTLRSIRRNTAKPRPKK